MTSAAEFVLHPRLAADTVVVGDLPLCRALLSRNACWPWLILVPRRAGAVEIHRLEAADQAQLMVEISQASRVLEAAFAPHKLNVAAIGNLVPQLHVHIVARTQGDAAWPGPIWGSGHERAYGAGEAEALAVRLATDLAL
ncbi:HIT domain-containing protein [Nitrospirillum iridis]|uniref:Diadenosine tetraphosphate (Ap4A) HIT family hydrolase n=1 Tax=Nitrospirillum iridis TaxID=765888 RepID=A0A7X0EF97_9PROT|nr:HIT domain-containing protein [Nitrospirillum iridis]MBB6254728.1 diadenosine tetraphosphate (Ap4A) HIT family hydrolase [Nitrospirillum iridis]